MRNTSYGRIDALAQTGEVSIPFVIIRNTTENVSIPYIGFIPGFFFYVQACKEFHHSITVKEKWAMGIIAVFAVISLVLVINGTISIN